MALEQRIRSAVPGSEINRFRQLLVFDRFLARIFRHFEGCILGSGGSEYGIALYEEQAAMEKLVKLHKAGQQEKAAQMKCVVVTFDPAPEFARDVLVEAIGVPVLPVPARVERGRMGPPVAADILALAAALVAASGLTPSTPISIGGVSDGRGSVTAKVTAPGPHVGGSTDRRGLGVRALDRNSSAF